MITAKTNQFRINKRKVSIKPSGFHTNYPQINLISAIKNLNNLSIHKK